VTRALVSIVVLTFAILGMRVAIYGKADQEPWRGWCYDALPWGGGFAIPCSTLGATTSTTVAP
jgi:hypothetical protein